MDDDMDAAALQVETEWKEATLDLSEKIRAVEACGSAGGIRDKAALPRLNAVVQDRFTAMQSLTLRLELIAQQQPSEEESEACLKKLRDWKKQFQDLRLNLRSANMKAKSNMERAAKQERELLLAGGEEATLRRRNLQTQAGMAAATESITEGLRRTRQMMVQEVERTTNTIQTLDQSNVTLGTAKDEYVGQRSILNRTRRLLTSMTRQDLIDRLILVVGITVFLLVCNYIFLKRLGIWRAQRTSPPIYGTHVPISQSSPSAVPTHDPVVTGDAIYHPIFNDEL